ncbi:MAG: type II secretion system F family protein [Planctomycetaceae bacterium]
MPRFQYTATDSDGNPRSGEIDAPTAAAAAQQLERDALHVISITFSPEAPPSSGPEAASEKPFPLTSKEFDTISGHVADLTSAKLPLPSGLKMLADEMPNRRLERALRGIANRLEQGMNIEQVLLAYDAPKELQAVFLAGQSSGRFADVLAQYIAHRRSRANTKLTMMLALGYPAILVIAAGSVILFMLGFLVPSFRKLSEDFGTEIPATTKLLFVWSDIVTRYGGTLLVGGVIVALMATILYRFISGKTAGAILIRQIPLAGTLWHWASMSQFCDLLAVMLENQVPLPNALLLAGDSAEDEGVRAGSRQMAALAAAGEPLIAKGVVLRGFPAAFIQVVTEHKQTDALPGALHAIADYFEGRSRLHSYLLASISGPFIIVVVGFIVGWITLSLFMPLIKLLNDLS